MKLPPGQRIAADDAPDRTYDRCRCGASVPFHDRHWDCPLFLSEIIVPVEVRRPEPEWEPVSRPVEPNIAGDLYPTWGRP
jgi:hypothetical protein